VEKIESVKEDIIRETKANKETTKTLNNLKKKHNIVDLQRDDKVEIGEGCILIRVFSSFYVKIKI